MARTRTGGDESTVLGLPHADRLVLLVGAPVLGSVLGALVPRAAEQAAALPWVPLQGPLELIASLDGRWSAVAWLVAGLTLGLGFAWFAMWESLQVRLTGDRVRLDRLGTTRTLERCAVAAVFLDGRQLVLLDDASRELVRETSDAGAERLEQAFRSQGWPWMGSDPYAERYRRWVPGTPDLPPGVDALLKARETALRKRDRDVAELREEMQKLGVVVRDEGSRQYWRPVAPRS